MDLEEQMKRCRPDTKLVLDKVTNVTFYVDKIKDHPIGCSRDLPTYVTDSRSVHALVRSEKTGRMYTDNLCFFRCLVLNNGNDVGGTGKTHQKLSCAICCGSPFRREGFRGIRLGELPLVQQIFERNVTVYAKVPKRELETVALPGPLPNASDLPPCEASRGVGGSLDDAKLEALMEMLTDDNDGYDDDDCDTDCDDDVDDSDEVTQETLADEVVDNSTGEDDEDGAVAILV